VLAGPWYVDAERDQAAEFVRAMGLQDVVRFTGPVRGDEKNELLREAAVLIMPSRWEGQPLVVLEALAAATPVLASRVGAVPDTVEDGVEGFLVEPGDITSLEQRLLQLLSEDSLRSELGTAARRRYEAEYTTERFAARVEGMLTTVAAADVELPFGSEPMAKASGQ
jgi:glycosyltransferase involved in cell wall biosynthesis